MSRARLSLLKARPPRDFDDRTRETSINRRAIISRGRASDYERRTHRGEEILRVKESTFEFLFTQHTLVTRASNWKSPREIINDARFQYRARESYARPTVESFIVRWITFYRQRTRGRNARHKYLIIEATSESRANNCQQTARVKRSLTSLKTTFEFRNIIVCPRDRKKVGL